LIEIDVAVNSVASPPCTTAHRTNLALPSVERNVIFSIHGSTARATAAARKYYHAEKLQILIGASKLQIPHMQANVKEELWLGICHVMLHIQLVIRHAQRTVWRSIDTFIRHAGRQKILKR
jgi:hypothetical protein